METQEYFSKEQINEKLPYIMESPKDNGILSFIVIRPGVDDRKLIQEGQLSSTEGLIGDSWNQRPSRHTPDNSPYIENQVTIMNKRVIESIAQNEERQLLAGDQLFVDFDLSEENLPPGSRLQIGNAIVQISHVPHNGCGKFKERFGSEALKFVNSEMGKANHFRGLNAKVIKEGKIQTGDPVAKLNI